MRAPTLILGVVSAVASVAGLFVDPAFGQTQPQVPPLNFAGSIHGVVLGETLEGGFPIDLAMPNAAVKVRDASDTVVGETKTNVAGTFASPVLAAGTYRVCASAVGFKEICASDSTTLVKATVALREPLTLTPLGGTLHGPGHIEGRFTGRPACYSRWELCRSRASEARGLGRARPHWSR